MYKLFIIFLLNITICLPTIAQPYVERALNYGDNINDWFRDVLLTSDGGYVIWGESKSLKTMEMAVDGLYV